MVEKSRRKQANSRQKIALSITQNWGECVLCVSDFRPRSMCITLLDHPRKWKCKETLRKTSKKFKRGFKKINALPPWPTWHSNIAPQIIFQTRWCAIGQHEDEAFSSPTGFTFSFTQFRRTRFQCHYFCGQHVKRIMQTSRAEVCVCVQQSGYESVPRLRQ